jgi:hypothetical protein
LKFHYSWHLPWQGAAISLLCYADFGALAIGWCLNRAGKIMQRICLQQRFQLLHLLLNCGSVYG